jgi:hypothetical protein
MNTFTFICFGHDGSSRLVDIQALADSGISAYAHKLLGEHASAASVEVWRGDQWLGRLDRGGSELVDTPA